MVKERLSIVVVTSCAGWEI